MEQSDFPVGSYVNNAKLPDWGIGKVLAVCEGGKRRVFFEFGGERLMTGLTLSPAPEPERHPLLSRMDARTDLHGACAFAQLEQAFLVNFPKGFDDPGYLANERDHRVAAAQMMAESCSKEVLSDLIAHDGHDEVCERARRILSKSSLVFPNEKLALVDGLKQGVEQRRLFATGLFDVLYGESELGKRFETFVGVLEELGALKWTTATYFLSLSQPEAYPFVKPSYVQDAAKTYAFELGYSSRPSSRCYARVRKFVRYVSEVLRRRGGLAPHDLIDVQGFIWCTLHNPVASGRHAGK